MKDPRVILDDESRRGFAARKEEANGVEIGKKSEKYAAEGKRGGV